MLKLFTMEYDLELILTILSFAIPSAIYVVKYIAFYIQSQKVNYINNTCKISSSTHRHRRFKCFDNIYNTLNRLEN